MSPIAISTRKYESKDRNMVLALGNHPGAIDSENNNVVVLKSGNMTGAVVWTWPGTINPDIPTLGGITVSDTSKREIYDSLLLGVCLEAQAAGHTKGQAMVLDEAFLKLMQQDFVITVEPVGINTETGKPGYWVIEFDLEENRKILLNRLGLSVI